MSTLYEYHAKVGTYSSTIIWLLEEAEIGKSIYGFWLEDRYTPYMEGQAFRYADANKFLITDIQDRKEDKPVITKYRTGWCTTGNR